MGEKIRIVDRISEKFKKLLSMFMLYFVLTVCFWGSADFILSFLATRQLNLSTGDTLAFLSVGNLIGTCIAKLVLWQWKKTSWGKFIAPIDDTELQTLPSVIALLETPQTTPRSRFAMIRSMVKKPVFLNDAFKLSFLSGMIGAVAPLGYFKLSVGGGEASTVAPLISLYVIVPTLIGIIVMKERKNVIKFAGIVCAIAAVVLFALGGGAKHWSLASVQNIGYFLLGFFGWGISYFIRGIAASKVVDFGHLLLMATAGLMFGNYILVTFVFGVSSFSFGESHGLTITSGCLQVLGDLGFFLLSKEGKEASKVVPLTGTYILLPAILGFVFLHDTVTIMKIVAIILSLLALGLLGMA